MNADLKLSNKNVHAHFVLCGKQNPCLNIALISELNAPELSNFKHSFTVNVNLIPWGATHELLIKSETNLHNRAFSHESSVDLKSADDKKYSYALYIKPPSSKIVLQIPSREVSIEANYRVPQNEWKGEYEIGVSTYWDKKRDPSKVSRVSLAGKINALDRNGWNTEVDFVVSHPSIKELKIKQNSRYENNEFNYKLENDVFQRTDQKVVVEVKNAIRSNELISEWSLRSSGLGLDYRYNQIAKAAWDSREFKYKTEFVGPTSNDKFAIDLDGRQGRMVLKLIAFNDELLTANSNIDVNARTASVNGKVKLLGTEPVEARAELRGISSASATIKQGGFFEIEAKADKDRELSLLVKGEGKNLVEARVRLDPENLLKTSYKVQDNDLKNFAVS